MSNWYGKTQKKGMLWIPRGNLENVAGEGDTWMSFLNLLPLHTASRSVSVYFRTENEMKQHVCFLIVSSCIAAPSVVCSVIQMTHL